MPEITSVDAIRTKLREFDERIKGAIVAAEALARVKADAQRLLKEVESVSTRSEQALLKVDGIRARLENLQNAWDSLRQDITKAQADSKEKCDRLLTELRSAMQSLGKGLAEAEERLRSTNQTSLAEQAALLKRLDAETREGAGVATKAKLAVLEQAKELEQLLTSLRDELQTEVRTRLLRAEKRIESQSQELSKELSEQSAKQERLLQSEINAFKEEMKRGLADHQQAIDRQLTGFLDRQNALVQNLTQQIDSFSRMSQVHSTDLAAANRKCDELASAFDTHKAATAHELAALAAAANELNEVLSEVKAGLRSQGEAIATVRSLSDETSTRLDQTLDKLRQLPLVGGKFK